MAVPASRRGWEGAPLALAGIALLYAAGALAAGISGAMAWTEAALFAAMFAVPAMAIGVALRSMHSRVVAAARVAAALVAVIYGAVLAGNWSTYDRRQAVLVPLLIAPAVLAYIVAMLGP